MSKYVYLDKYFKNYSDGIRKKIIKPNELHGPSSKYYGCYFLSDIDGKDYFIKICKDDKITYSMYAELISEELASLVNLRIIDSNIALINLGAVSKPNHKNCLISEDYRKPDYDIYTMKEIVLEYLESLEKDNLLKDVIGISKVDSLFEEENYDNINSLSIIWNAYLYHYKDYPNCNDIVESKVVEQVKRYIFRFLVMDKDFHLENSEELDNYSKGLTQMSPIYDLDESFARDFDTKNNSLKSETYQVDDPYEDFENFIKYSDESFCEMAYNMYKVLNQDTVKNSFNIVNENKHVEIPLSIKDEMLSLYEEHYEKVGNILKKYYKQEEISSKRR